jgi:RimK family alpha-L-glutamate ligase
MKRAIIIINAYSTLPTGLNQAKRLKSEFSRLGVDVEIRRNGFFATVGEKIESRLSGFDFCVYLDKDKYASAILEKTGLRLFNRHTAVRVCDDKMETHLALTGRGVPMPETVAGLLCYDEGTKTDAAELDFLEKKLGFPVIVKESFGSLGKGVYKVDDRVALEAIMNKLKRTPHLFQKFVSSSAGKDVRVIAIGGKAVAAMERISAADFRSNLELGGTAQPYEIDGCLRDICELTAKTLNLDYCGIDVLFGENGYLVCEVNSNAFFGGIERVTGVNIARIYAEYIFGEIYG